MCSHNILSDTSRSSSAAKAVRALSERVECDVCYSENTVAVLCNKIVHSVCVFVQLIARFVGCTYIY